MGHYSEYFEMDRQRLHELDVDDETGFNTIPKRYDTGGREAIDLIRDRLGDEAFVNYCRGCVLKYRIREGKKDSPDREKIRWYLEMIAHVLTGTPDPRSNRPGFKPYERQPPTL